MITTPEQELRITVPVWMVSWLKSRGGSPTAAMHRILYMEHGRRKQRQEEADALYAKVAAAYDSAASECAMRCRRLNADGVPGRNVVKQSRYAAAVVMTEDMQVQLTAIGRCMGKDHSTVSYYIASAAKLAAKDVGFAWVLARTRELLGGSPAGFKPK